MTTKSSLRRSGDEIIAFNGAVTTKVLHDPSRAFAFDITFLNDHPQLVAVASQKPPLHFHPYQHEFIQVLEGRLWVEIDGKVQLAGSEHGEICIEPWANHRLYPPSKETSPVTRFLLWGERTEETYRLDLVFFTNWYAYQDEVVVGGKRIDLIQVLSMFDAGASYLSVPWWIPFGQYLSRAVGIALGRWVGGLLGYQPFYDRWTLDWDAACSRMETSVFQRRFADRTKTE